MAFNSLIFVFAFLPVTWVGWLLLRMTRYANAWLLACSIFFYVYGELWWIVPFFVSAILDFYLGQSVHFQRNQRARRNIIILSVAANLGILGFFKYTTWLTGAAAGPLASIGIILPVIAVGLPAGISFYTFQSLSYTIDIYRREFKPVRNIIDYLTFVAFFPQLVAGPIMRARDLLPQISERRSLPTAENLSLGFFMILYGLFLKIVLADHFGGLVEAISRIMAAENKLAPGLGLLFAYGFAGQIYCDFMAYSTIAWGAAKMFNVELMHNFKTPYFAVSPSDFWRRWHISLSTWLRDYLYIPLGGNRYGVSRTQINLMLTMLLGGIWHGASIMFVFWGLWHGLLLAFYRAVPIDQFLIKWFGRAGRIAAMLLMFHLVCFGWILFRASAVEFPIVMASIVSFPGELVKQWQPLAPYWKSVLAGDASGLAVLKGTVGYYYSQNFYFWVFGYGLALVGAVLFVFDYAGYRIRGEFWQYYPRMSTALKVVLMLFFVYAIILLGRRQANDFIYFAF